MLAAVLFCGLAGWFFYLSFKPELLSRTEIYQGVYLTVEELPQKLEGRGKVMIIEVYWDTPGVRIENRPFDFSDVGDHSDASHYRLEFADLALRRTNASILMNTSLYRPGALVHSIPGRPVQSVETLVVDGVVSHVHDHSYLLFWNVSMDAKFLQSKPPDPVSLSEAVMGVSTQGVQIAGGDARYNALGNREEIHARTFIGVDPDNRVLYLMAFENVSGYTMIDRAIAAGVVFGGQLDSGNSTNLLIGENARRVKAHSGIRNLRPLGPYISIYAEPL